MKKPVSTPKKADGRQENSDATQAALRAAGRGLFGQLGYDASSVTALCAEAKVTSGALYHHFGDKKGLYAAVAEELDSQLAAHAQQASVRAMKGGGTPWDAFLAGVDALLQAGTNAEGRRIGLVDAPTVLGGDAWLAIRERHGLGAMIRAVEGLQALGVLAPGDARRQARIILGLLYGAIDAMPAGAGQNASGVKATRDMVHTMLNALRCAHASSAAAPAGTT